MKYLSITFLTLLLSACGTTCDFQKYDYKKNKAAKLRVHNEWLDAMGADVQGSTERLMIQKTIPIPVK